MHLNILEQAIIEAKKNTDLSLNNAQNMLLEYLMTQPQDTAAWLLITRIECSKSVEYADRIEHYAEKILEYDPENAYALLFLAYAEYYMRGCSTEHLIYKLDKAKSDNPEVLSMIELAKAFYWKHRDSQKYIDALRKSIKYSPYQRINYCMLGEVSIEQGKVKEGIELMKKGFDNIKKIDTGEEPIDPTSIPNFLAEFFAGTIINTVSYLILKQKISKQNNL